MLTRSPSAKNSFSATSATNAATPASSAAGPYQTSATTTGISTAAVKIRISIAVSASPRARVVLGPDCAEPAVPPLALLKIYQRFQQPHARKVRPQSLGHVNLRVGNLPQQKIADAHFAAGADQQIGIRQPGRIKMIGNVLFVGAKCGQPVRAHVIEHGVERVCKLGAP